MTKQQALQRQALSLWTGNAIYHGIEYVPRTGLNLLRYKRRLRRMAAEVCPPDKSWEVIVALFAAVALFVGAFIAWGNGLV